MLKRTLLTFATAVILGSAATPAEAVRPIAGHDYPDLCKNRGEYAMTGKQTVLMLLGGYVQYADPYQEPNRLGKRDCVYVAAEGRRG